MTPRHTTTQIAAYTDQIRKLTRKQPKQPEAELDRLERRLKRAIERDATGSPGPDGYPHATSGANPGTGSNGNDPLKLTSVETAAMSPRQRDRHHDLTIDACAHLEEGLVHLRAAIARLDSIDDQLVIDPAPRTCQACTGHRGKRNRPVAHRGTVGDRLPTAVDLCEDCWWFVRRGPELPGTRTGRFPTPDEIRLHEQRGRWRRLPVPVTA